MNQNKKETTSVYEENLAECEYASLIELPPLSKLDMFLMTRKYWNCTMRSVAENYNERGFEESKRISLITRLNQWHAPLLAISARGEKINCDRPTAVAIASIHNWWVGNILANGSLVVVTEKALDTRFFPLDAHSSNLIFPSQSMFSPVLEKAGLPSELRGLDGNRLFLVFGAVLMSYYAKQLPKPSPLEIEVSRVDQAEMVTFPWPFQRSVRDRGWIESVLARYSKKRRPLLKKRSKLKLRERSDSLARMAMLFSVQMPTLCSTAGSVFFTSGALLKAGREIGLFKGIEFENDEDAVRRISCVMGARNLDLPWMRSDEGRQWFLPAVKMDSAVTEWFLNLEWAEISKVCDFVYIVFASPDLRFRFSPSPDQDWHHFWTSMVPSVPPNQLREVHPFRMFHKRREIPWLSVRKATDQPSARVARILGLDEAQGAPDAELF